jgi:3-deoxy-D-manno-octulosonate 8-phosphate phosphatase (KDO 8-P phosphatase)
MLDILDRAARIQLVVFDVDGVLTDGKLYFSDEGLETKAFHSRDGHGMKLLLESGIPVAIITGRTSRVVEHRMRGLGVSHVQQGVQDKEIALLELCERLGIPPSATACMGDDIIDLPMLHHAGLAATVRDAPEFVRRHVHWVATRAGGEGAARELCELVLEGRGLLDSVLERYLR